VELANLANLLGTLFGSLQIPPLVDRKPASLTQCGQFFVAEYVVLKGLRPVGFDEAKEGRILFWLNAQEDF
jgi:hypothetical protein